MALILQRDSGSSACSIELAKPKRCVLHEGLAGIARSVSKPVRYAKHTQPLHTLPMNRWKIAEDIQKWSSTESRLELNVDGRPDARHCEQGTALS